MGKWADAFAEAQAAFLAACKAGKDPGSLGPRRDVLAILAAEESAAEVTELRAKLDTLAELAQSYVETRHADRPLHPLLAWLDEYWETEE